MKIKTKLYDTRGSFRHKNICVDLSKVKYIRPTAKGNTQVLELHFDLGFILTSPSYSQTSSDTNEGNIVDLWMRSL